MAPAAANVKKTGKSGDLRMFFGGGSAKTPTTSQKSGSSTQVARNSSQVSPVAGAITPPATHLNSDLLTSAVDLVADGHTHPATSHGSCLWVLKYLAYSPGGTLSSCAWPHSPCGLAWTLTLRPRIVPVHELSSWAWPNPPRGLAWYLSMKKRWKEPGLEEGLEEDSLGRRAGRRFPWKKSWKEIPLEEELGEDSLGRRSGRRFPWKKTGKETSLEGDREENWEEDFLGGRHRTNLAWKKRGKKTFMEGHWEGEAGRKQEGKGSWKREVYLEICLSTQ
ncbi:hypothetical protein DFP72DRAFT_859626 [Ephemerocybe angulata]|uniref:Uncharacterized protein n=1 Tax=Ephemerocybe angulata TaxID=980116 RepID=A0A8H6LVV6_9AGAR|nr:hypothetical protein DFP72DRAFT_859626 [Tulosesus angulatus]